MVSDIIRGVTYHVIFHMNRTKVSELSSIDIIFRQGLTVFSKNINDIQIDTENNYIITTLSHSETMGLNVGVLNYQIFYKEMGNNDIKATYIEPLRVYPNLSDINLNKTANNIDGEYWYNMDGNLYIDVKDFTNNGEDGEDTDSINDTKTIKDSVWYDTNGNVYNGDMDTEIDMNRYDNENDEETLYGEQIVSANKKRETNKIRKLSSHNTAIDQLNKLFRKKGNNRMNTVEKIEKPIENKKVEFVKPIKHEVNKASKIDRLQEKPVIKNTATKEENKTGYTWGEM